METTDELILQATSVNNDFIKQVKLLFRIRNMNLENSNLLAILKLIMTENGSFINKDIYTKSVYSALKNGDCRKIFLFLLFSRVIPRHWLKNEKVFKYARRSLKMIKTLQQVHYFPNFFTIRNMISAGYITNAIYVLSDSKNYFLQISGPGIYGSHYHDDLIDMYKLAIQKYKSHRLFNFLFQKYGFLSDKNKTIILSFLKDDDVVFCQKLRY